MRRARLRALPLLGAVLAGAGMRTVAPAQPLNANQAAQHPDSLLLDMAEAIVRGGPAANRLWHAPWYTHEFVIMVPDGRAVVVLPDLPPLDLGLPRAERVIGDSFPAVYLFPPITGLPKLHGSQLFSGRLILAWPQYDSVFGIHDPLFATVMVMYHEIFHVYQARSKWLLPGGSEPPPEIVISRQFQQLAAEERTLLVRALDSSDPDSLEAIVRSYLQIRDQRMNLLPAEARATESSYESLEGTANYVAYRAALQALGRDDADFVKILKYDLVNTPPFDDPTRELGSYRHWHVYATGAAVAFLLERLGAARSWHAALEDGRTYQELIGAAVR